MTLPPDSQTPTSQPPRAPRPSPRRSGRGLLIGGVTALLLAGAWAGSTVYSAGQAEALSNRASGTIDAALRSNNLGKVERHTFARGLTSSTDDIYLVPDDASAPMRLHLRNRIQHGPLPGLSAVGQAIVDTEIVWDDAKVQAAVDRAFGGKKPNLHTVIGLGGNTDATLSVPAGSYSGGQGEAAWQALGGQFRVSSAGRGVNGTMNWPGGSIRGTDTQGVLELKEMRYTIDQQPYLAKLSQGKSSFTVASVTLPQGVGRMNTLNVTTTTAPSGTAMQSRTQATVASLDASGQKFSDLRLVLSASKLSSAALEELSGLTQTPDYKALTGQASQGAEQVNKAALERLLADLTPTLQKLLAGNPELRIDEASAQTPQGRLKLALGAQVVNGDKIDLKPLLGQDTLKAGAGNPALLGLLGNLKLSADIEGQEAVIAGLLGGSGNDTAASIAQSIDPMIQQGMITRTGDTLKTHLEFSQGGATINGKPFGQ